MIVQRIIKRLIELQADEDRACGHAEADDLLCELLVSLGYSELVKEYKKIYKYFS